MPPVSQIEINIPTDITFQQEIPNGSMIEIDTQPGIIKYQVFHNLDDPDPVKLINMVAWLDSQALDDSLCNTYPGERSDNGSENNNTQGGYFLFKDLDIKTGRIGVLSLDAQTEDIIAVMDRVFGISERSLGVSSQKRHEIRNIVPRIALQSKLSKPGAELIGNLHSHYVDLARCIDGSYEFTIWDTIRNCKLFFSVHNELSFLEGEIVHGMTQPGTKLSKEDMKLIINENVFMGIKELAINARKYGEDQSAILSVEKENDNAIFTFYDRGIGISRQDLQFGEGLLPPILQEHYRGENAGEIEGTGMGLSYYRKPKRWSGCFDGGFN